MTGDDLQLGEQMYPKSYFWSPDGRYLALFFDKFESVHVRGDPGVAIINSDGQNFQVLGWELAWPENSPWRPPIPLQPEE